jgi:prostatic aicd phosphatase
MLALLFIVSLLISPLVAAQQQSNSSSVVAVLLIGRHGDRTSKIQGNSQLTTLGKHQAFNTGSFFRSRYLNTSSPDFIANGDTNYLSQQVSAVSP